MFSGLVEELWIKWELPGMVVLSLLLQFLLVGFGNRQRYQGRWSPYVAMLVWSTYLLADWVATVALSALLKAKKHDLNSELVVFWAPFLLLHLGGPHTISAYSLADNEIWLRYLFGLVIQVGVAIYVYIKFRTNSTLTYIAIPIFMAGITKYAERVWILRAASHKQFSNSVFSSPKGATTKSNGSTSSPLPQTLDDYLKHRKVIEGGESVHKAFCLFKMFKPLFSDLRLRIFRKLSNNLLSPFNSAEDAFTLVHIELGFLYDVLYTKATIMQEKVGLILRSICLLSTFAALIAFSITVGKSGYPREDISITYVLLGGAILLDIFSAISHALSSWTILWLTNPSKLVSKFACQRIVSWLVLRNAEKKGRVSMAQHSLIDYCLKVKTSKWTTILSVLDTEDIVGKLWWTTWEEVNWDLKKFIYSNLQEKFERYQNSDDENVFNYDLLQDILKERGDHVLQSYGLKVEFKWSINDVEFSHSILAWHIATFILFYDDHKRYSGGVLGSYCQISKLLSDYMMYLLLVQPLMLPKGIGRVRIKDTRVEVIRYYGDKSSSMSNKDAASALLPSGNELPLLSTESKSVLRDG
ncbi:hypothetical protein SLA2020_341250 [Shorea laevis]